MRDDAPTSIPESFRVALRPVIQRIVEGDFDGLIRDGFAPRHIDGDLGMWVRDYPMRLVSIPEEAWQFAHCGRIEVESSWWVDVDLWTADGRSDLTLEATLRETPRGIAVEIDDIHVM